MLIEAILLLVSILAYYGYKIHKKQSTHWSSMGVKVPPGLIFPLGNAPDMSASLIVSGLNSVDLARKQYKAMQGEKYYGTYMTSNPVLVLTDPDVIKTVMVKDFNFFVDRLGGSFKKVFDVGVTRTDEISRRQLSTISGEEWKNVRSTYSPIFTSGKMKAMMVFIREVEKNLMKSLDEEAKKGTEFDLREKFGKYGMDVLASCAFGVDAQSFTNPNSDFVKHAKNMFRKDTAVAVKFLSLLLIPGASTIFKLFRIPVFKPTETQFLDEVMQATLNDRKKSNFKRNDLIDMMLDAMKEDDPVEDDDKEADKDAKLSHKVNKKDLDDISIIATAIVMLVGGYETTGMTMSYIAYELAMNQDVQRRLQDEIDDAIARSDGKQPDYNVIQSMEYLDMVFYETLRKYPALGIISRACTQDYTLPGTEVKISKGDFVFINAAGVHMDPKYYPEPEKFNPENFSKEAKASRHPYAFLGFGQGPRNCMGMRFAILETKVALISLLSKYTLVKSESTVEKVQLDPNAIMGICKHGLFVKLEPRS